jgi:hypothetical protein
MEWDWTAGCPGTSAGCPGTSTDLTFPPSVEICSMERQTEHFTRPL